MLNKLSLLVLCAVVAAPAGAQGTSPAATNAAAKAADPNKLVCEREEKVGSRLGGKRVCLTVKEWDERRAAHRENAETVQAGARAMDSMDPPIPGFEPPGPR